MADASNRGDPIDSKRAYGVAAMWMGGPVITVSKKLEHSSSATAANEYMALSHATKHTIWLRYLLQDMGLGDMLDGPTCYTATTRLPINGSQMIKYPKGTCGSFNRITT